jgi:hypothetical protein
MRTIFVVWSGWLVLMAGANLATPLYSVYAKRFGFSSLVLTAVFATYAFVLVPSLILFGRLSDRFGRRPIILAGLGVAGSALLLFVFAGSPAWLFGARALQGLAVGMISGAAAAALVEHDPDRDRRRAALFAGLAQAGGRSSRELSPSGRRRRCASPSSSVSRPPSPRERSRSRCTKRPTASPSRGASSARVCRRRFADNSRVSA